MLSPGLLTGGSDGTVRVWSVGSGDGGAEGGAAQDWQPAQTLTTKATPVAAVAFTRRNLLLAAGSLVVPQTGKQLQ